MTLGEQLEIKRQRLKMTKKDLAASAGIMLPTLRNILSSKETVTLGNYIRVARALNSTLKITVE